MIGFGIGILIGLLLCKFVFTGKQETESMEIVKGQETSELITGVEVIGVEKKVSIQRGVVKPSRDVARYVSTDTLVFNDDDYDLILAVTHDKITDSITVDYFLSFNHRTITRVDTLLVTRVDTLKQTTVIETETKFYEKPAFVITAGIVIGYLLKAVSGR